MLIIFGANLEVIPTISGVILEFSASTYQTAQMAAEAAPSGEEALPVVEVYKKDGDALVKWGEGGAQMTTGGLGDKYTEYFQVVDSNGDEPLIKTFGSPVAVS